MYEQKVLEEKISQRGEDEMVRVAGGFLDI